MISYKNWKVIAGTSMAVVLLSVALTSNVFISKAQGQGLPGTGTGQVCDVIFGEGQPITMFQEHWDKIIFMVTKDPSKNKVFPVSLLNKELDIKVLDDTSKVADIQQKVKNFLAGGPSFDPSSRNADYTFTPPPLTLTQAQANALTIKIVSVQYAIVCSLPPQALG